MAHDDLPAREHERGFTLVELLVVVLIIGILLAIGVPALVGARQTAQARGVQADVRNAFVATRIYYNQSLVYTDSPAEMRAIEPSLAWTNASLTASSPQRAIGIKAYAGDTVIMVGRTRDGRCFYLKDQVNGISGGTYYERDVDGGDCDLPPTPGAFSGWATSWADT